MAEQDISIRNTEFWDELCGTQLAHSLGIADDSPASLKRFDDWYFEYYPYLADHVPFATMRDRDVLEVGLGYGTVSQRIADNGARYRGLDIAAGPVAMVNRRLGASDGAVQGDILDPPFGDNSFDYIVAIGCLHHTGDLARATERCRGLLRPGGTLIFMVYYAYSFRRWRWSTATTLGYALKEIGGYRGVVGDSTEKDRAAYDTDSTGAGAPHTDWISVRSLRALCGTFSRFDHRVENFDGLDFPFRIPRDRILRTFAPAVAGLDLYATATR